MNYRYIHKSIIDGSKIQYNPMRVIDQKILVQESDMVRIGDSTPEDFMETLVSVIVGLTDRKETELYYADLECLFFLIRAKSYGSKINFTKKIGSGKNIKIHELEFDIEKDLKFPSSSEASGPRRVTLENQTIEIAPLNVNEYMDCITLENKIEKNYAMISKSIRKIITDEEVILFQNDTEKMDFVNDLFLEDFKKIVKEYNSFPQINVFKLYEVDGSKFTVNFEDFESFFFVA